MQRAQGALEYLLLIGGALLVAVIIISIIVSITSSGEDEAIRATASALCAKFPENMCEDQTVTVRGKDFACWVIASNTCRVFDGVLLMHLNDNVAGNGQTIKDSATNPHNGATIGNLDCTVAGKFGGACKFDVDGVFISVPDPDIVEGKNALTASAWIKVVNPPLSLGAVVEQTGNPGFVFQLFSMPGCNPPGCKAIRFEVYTPSQNVIMSNTTISNDDWHHIAGVYDGSEMRIYLDGKIKGTAPNSGPTNYTTAPLTIGDGDRQIFYGFIDEVAIWDKALPPERIQQMANR